jgi:hypothetical protein
VKSCRIHLQILKKQQFYTENICIFWEKVVLRVILEKREKSLLTRINEGQSSRMRRKQQKANSPAATLRWVLEERRTSAERERRERETETGFGASAKNQEEVELRCGGDK